jgi:hypothetical protein
MLLKLLMLLTVVDGSTAAVTAANDVKAAALKTVNATAVGAVAAAVVDKIHDLVQLKCCQLIS